MFKKIVSWFYGRHTMFAIFFTISGTILEWHSKLEPSYVALIGAIQSFVFAHSVKEDYMELKRDNPVGDTQCQAQSQ